jgi:Right handed beta helix region
MLKSSRSNSSQSNVARSLLVVAVWVLAALLPAPSAFAETLYVSPTGKDLVKFGGHYLVNSCSLANHPCRTIRYAVALAQDGDLVSVAGGTYVETIDVSRSITIEGAGALSFGVGAQNTWVDGNKQGSVFTIAPEATVFIRYMLIRNAKGPGIINWGKLTVKGVIVGANSEAGISNGTKGTLHLERVWLYKNNGPGLSNVSYANLKEVFAVLNQEGMLIGGKEARSDVTNSAFVNNRSTGVSSYGKLLSLTNVTISGNAGFGVVVGDGSDLSLRFVTVAANAASKTGAAGISAQDAGNISILGSIIHGNGKGVAAQCSLKIGFDVGYNIVPDNSCTSFPAATTGADPKLKPLANNGGFTLTHALSPGSPAIDLVPEGPDCTTSKDQRGVVRPNDGNGDGKVGCDAGAYEFKP